MQISFARSWREQSTQMHMQEPTQLLGKNAHFFEGAMLFAQEICIISAQSSQL